MQKHLPLTDAGGEVRELTEGDYRKAVPFTGLPASLQAKLHAIKKGGRPKAAVTKVHTTIRLSPDVLEGLRATGRGWQTRADEALREWVKAYQKGA